MRVFSGRGVEQRLSGDLHCIPNLELVVASVVCFLCKCVQELGQNSLVSLRITVGQNPWRGRLFPVVQTTQWCLM